MPVPRCIASTEHSNFDMKVIAGHWPEDISGEMCFASPGPKGVFDYMLFSPGHVVRMSLRPGTFGAAPDRFAWRSRRIDSPSILLHDRRPDVFHAMGPGMVSPFGLMNMANTAVMPWKGRLFATWDVGRPVEVDPITLDFLAEVGSKDSWGTSMPIPGVSPFLMSTAHPIIDPERDCMWSVRLTPGAAGSAVHLVRYSGGDTVDTWPLEGGLIGGTMHCISQTRDWLMLMDSGNFKMDPGEMAGGERSVLMDLESPVFFLRKDEVEKTIPGQLLAPTRMMMGPAVGHFYARYDDSDGVQAVFEHMDGLDLGFFLKEDDLDAHGERIHPSQVGLYNMSICPSSLSEVRFDPDRGSYEQSERIRADDMFHNKLSAIDWSLEGLSNPTLHHQLYGGYRPGNITQRSLNAYRERVDPADLPDEELPAILMSTNRGRCTRHATYTYPSVDVWPCSPIFVPRDAGRAGRDELTGSDPGGHDGYVVVAVLSDDGLMLDCFDAADVSQGPVATLKGENDEKVGLVIHSCWLPQARPAPGVERLRFGDELAKHGQDLPDDLRAVAEDVARELDQH